MNAEYADKNKNQIPDLIKSKNQNHWDTDERGIRGLRVKVKTIGKLKKRLKHTLFFLKVFMLFSFSAFSAFGRCSSTHASNFSCFIRVQFYSSSLAFSSPINVRFGLTAHQRTQ